MLTRREALGPGAVETHRRGEHQNPETYPSN